MKRNFVIIILFCIFSNTLIGQIPYYVKHDNYQALHNGYTGENMQKLDSVISLGTGVDKYKQSFIYDERGNVKTIFDAYINSEGGQWKTIGRREVEYDSRNLVIKEAGYQDNNEDNIWIGTSKYEYTYDLNGNLTEYLYCYWDAGDWLNYQKIEYIFDENSNLIFETHFEWYKWQDVWKRTWKYELAYNDSNCLLESWFYLWQEGSDIWKIAGRTKYIYDDHLNQIEKLRSQWSEDVNFWIKKEKYNYSYDTAGKLLNELRANWDTSLNQWLNEFKYEYAYDESNRIIENINYHWISIFDNWSVLSRFQYIYDTDGNRTQLIESDWDDNGNVWINKKKTEYNYNNIFSRTDLILPYYNNADLDTLFTHMLNVSEYFTWKQSSNKWEHLGQKEYYYSDITFFGIADNYDLGIKIFPNPASELLTIDLGNDMNHVQFDLFDIHGKKMITKQLVGTTYIDVSGFSSGMFFYIFSSVGKAQSGKLIIR